ncbi:hypothetical protein Afil01_15030 [Actinorhabdospora filicis]|uniref:LPXTG cell wall anchor domain-containing protein n=1 Tax=Actinorhabdospora filicis TaxID=1785913 RepID=A0A9W6SJD6_9ACTN|nr:hypothetical protein [Actinorhabdospora filicis]GLZ76696.1 hypothetical protein Afil01_15030 [Actinorhabdospora filicis]
MTPVVSRAVLNLAAFLVAGSLLMLLLVKPGTAEQIITVFSLGLGLTLGAIAIFLVRRSRRQTPHKEDQ